MAGRYKNPILEFLVFVKVMIVIKDAVVIVLNQIGVDIQRKRHRFPNFCVWRMPPFVPTWPPIR